MSSRSSLPKVVRDLKKADERAVIALMDFGRSEPPPTRWARGHDAFPAMTAEACAIGSDDAWMQAFAVWTVYHRLPKGARSRHLPSGGTLAARFLRENGVRVSENVRRYIEAARREPFRIWETAEIDKGKSMLLRDLLTGREALTFDRAMSSALSRWDLVCAHVVGWDDMHVISAPLPFSLPATVRDELVRRLTRIRAQSEEQLLMTQSRILRLFGEALGSHYSRVPEVTNTDGHSLVWTTTTYAFDPSARGAVLRVLQRDRAVESVEGEPEPAGARFRWFRRDRGGGGMSTSLGTITVGDAEVTLECNSTERDRVLRKRLEAALAGRLHHLRTTQEPIDTNEMIAQMRSRPQSAAESEVEPPEPEVVAAMDHIHMQWLEKEVPALGGLTPRKAVKTPAGRAKVIALLRQFENMEGRRPPGYSFDVNRLRRELKLPLE